MILIDSQQKTLTSVLGAAEETYIVNNSILMQIFIKPTTSSTTYDFSLKDVYDNVVFSETNCDGEFNHLLSVPVYGNTVLTIDNSSVDEDYKCVLTFRRS